MRRLLPIPVGLCLAVVLAAPAYSDADTDTCFKESGDAAIAGCTRAIQSGRFNNSTLAILFNNRAIEYRQAGDYDRAIADYTQTIRLDPDFTGAYSGRGLAYEGKGDTAKALADYRKALTVAPKHNDGQWAHDTARERLKALAGPK